MYRQFAHKNTDDLNCIDKYLDIIGGCETLTLYKYLQSLGFIIRSTFDQSASSSVYNEVIQENSIYLKQNNQYNNMIISQLQNLSFAFVDIEFFNNKKLKNLGKTLRIFCNEKISELKYSIKKIQEKRKCSIYILTPIQYYSPALGYFDYRSIKYWTKYEFVLYYKMCLYELARTFPDIYILDVDIALERYGKIPSMDSSNIKLFENKGGHLEKIGGAILGEEFIYQLFINSKKIKRIKCVVLDCDNTLYSGVIREDGIDNLKVTWDHVLKILKLLSLYERGIMLTLCSKNDEADKELILNALKQFYEKTYGGNFYEKILLAKINWKPKSENIKEIANELNINLDTIAFFDDNEYERAEVRQSLPMVHVYSDYDILMAPEFPEFQPLGRLTEESLTRSQKYKEEEKRKNSERIFGASKFEEFLMSCDMHINFHKALNNELNRVVEILQRTNQMNATLKRMSESDVFNYNKNYYIYVMYLSDNFGDYGLIGALLFKISNNIIYIDELALSCRAMGRKIEDAFIQEIIYIGHEYNCNTISIEVTINSRNEQFIEMLYNNGFKTHNSIDLSKLNKNANNNISNYNKNTLLNLNITNLPGRNFAKWFTIDKE